MRSLFKEKLALYHALFAKAPVDWTKDDTELGICLLRDSELHAYFDRALDTIQRTDSITERIAPGKTFQMIDEGQPAAKGDW